MKKKWICLLTALTLLIGVCAAAPLTSGAVVLDLDKECSMTIYPESPKKTGQTFWEDDMWNADIKVDVYKVADAVKQPGYDMYSYKFDYTNSKYGSLSTSLPSDLSTLKAADWQKLAQDAAKLALDLGENLEADKTNAGKNKDNPVATIIVNEKPTVSADDVVEEEQQETSSTVACGTVEDLKPGLYLIIPRSSNMPNVEDYKIRMGSRTGDIATIANSDLYTYIFSPELISVPMRGTLEEDETALDVSVSSNDPQIPSGPQMSSDVDSWIYDLEVYLKPIRVRRYGALEIIKELDYESEEEVQDETSNAAGQDEITTFVFKAEWTAPEKNPDGTDKIETRVDSLTFKGNSEKSQNIVIDRIPVSNTGSTEVKVSEIYEGASYELAEGVRNPQTVTLTAERVQNGIAILDENNAVKTIIGDAVAENREAKIARFTNTYNRLQRKGYGINNTFEYDGEGGWNWYQDGVLKGNIKENGEFTKKTEQLEVTDTTETTN